VTGTSSTLPLLTFFTRTPVTSPLDTSRILFDGRVVHDADLRVLEDALLHRLLARKESRRCTRVTVLHRPERYMDSSIGRVPAADDHDVLVL